MSGEWLKIENDTVDKDQIFTMAEILGIDPDAVLGKCIRVWAWYDTHTVDGNAPVTVIALLDRVTCVSGFCAAMVSCGWLVNTGDELQVPDFGKHNGKSAKARAQTRNRVELKRSRDAKSNAKRNAPSVTKTLLEEEEEVRVHTLTPQAGEEQDSAGELSVTVTSTDRIPSPGFPERQAVLDYATARGWEIQSAVAFWLHYDQARSNGDRTIGRNWHWWSRLEHWVMNDAAGVGRGPGKGAPTRSGGGAAKPGINDFEKAGEWEDWQNTPGAKAPTAPAAPTVR